MFRWASEWIEKMGLTCGGMVLEGDNIMQGWMKDESGYSANHPECRRGGSVNIEGNGTLAETWTISRTCISIIKSLFGMHV